jgi:hypothetical protein
MTEILRKGHVVTQVAYVVSCERCQAEVIVRGNLLNELISQMYVFGAAHRECAGVEEEQPRRPLHAVPRQPKEAS